MLDHFEVAFFFLEGLLPAQILNQAINVQLIT